MASPMPAIEITEPKDTGPLSNRSSARKSGCLSSSPDPAPTRKPEKQPALPGLRRESILSSIPGSRRPSHVPPPSQRALPPDPDPLEEDLETVLDIREEYPPYDDTGTRTYLRACRKLRVIPASSLARKLPTATNLDLQFYGLGPKGTLAMAMALVINTQVTTLNIKGNHIGQDGVQYVKKMMEDNFTITSLNLAENSLRRAGAEAIGSFLLVNKSLRELDVSGNEFTDTDAIPIAKSVEDHTSLQKLVLSKNNFGDLSAPTFERMIAENGSLQELDLSWNHFRGPGARRIGKGLAENVSLKIVSLAWNGFDDEGAIAMRSALESNHVMEEFDLTCNRIGPEGFLDLMNAFKQNDTLHTLKIGQNNIPEEAAKAACLLLQKQDNVKLKLLDLSEIILSAEFGFETVGELRNKHPELDVRYGYTDSYGKRKMKGYDSVEEAIGIIKEYLEKRGLTVAELFARFDADGSMSVTHEEFREGLKESGIPLSGVQVDELVQDLDRDGDGEIDFSELVVATKEQRG